MTRERSHLAEAEDWLIAQLRGNSKVSDDKCLHIAMTHIEAHYGFGTTSGIGGVRARLDALTKRTDDMGPRGRACVLTMWAMRQTAFDDFIGWKWITQAQEMEGTRS